MDRDVRLTHLIDQAGADAERLAPLLKQIYRTLVHSGMPPGERAIVMERQITRLLGQNPDADVEEITRLFDRNLDSE